MSSGNMIAVPKELIDRIMRAFPDPSVTKADILTPTNDPDMVVKETFDRNILPLYSRKGGNPFFDKQGHVAEPGDTWKSIAAKYGVSADDLVIANPHIPPLTLSPGNFVLVPKKYGFNEFVEGIIHPDTNMNLQYDGDTPQPADPTAPPDPQLTADNRSFRARAVDAMKAFPGAALQRIKELTPSQVAVGAALLGSVALGGTSAIVPALMGARALTRGDTVGAVQHAIPGIAAGMTAVGHQVAPSWVPASAPMTVFDAMNGPAGRIATGAAFNAAKAFGNAEGGFKNRLGAAGLSLGASLLPGASVAFADSQAGVSAVKSILDQFGLSSAVDPTSVLQIVKMFGPGALRMLFPPNIDPKLADSAIGRIVDSLYSSHLWGQYLRGPPAAPADTVPPGYISTGNMTMIQPGDTNWPPPRDGFTEWAARGPAVTVMPPPVNNQSNGFTSWTPPTNTIPPNSIYDPLMSAQAGGDPYGQVVLGGGSPYSQVATTSGYSYGGNPYAQFALGSGTDPYARSFQSGFQPPPEPTILSPPPYMDGSNAVVDPSAMGAYSINSGYYSPYYRNTWVGVGPQPNSTSTGTGWSVPLY
eukprot:jgi/Mesvir1/9990/Mv05781-RA.1